MLFKGRTVVLLVGLAVLLNSIFMFTIKEYPLFADGQATQISDGLTSNDIQKLNSVVNVIENKYLRPVEHSKIMEGAVQGMIDSLKDPHCSYMGEEQAKKFNNNVEGTFIGIGVSIMKENNEIVVMSPFKGSPAEKAGIKPKDIIYSVDGVKLKGKTEQEAVNHIRGPKGKEIKIRIKRVGQSTPSEPIAIVLNDVEIETVSAKVLDSNIGYIEVSQFAMNTPDHFQKELEQLEKKAIKGLILDLRHNPGGTLEGVQKMAELFVPEGKPIVHTEDRDKKRESYISEGGSKLKLYPVVVLINKGSASAAEAMAAALQESAGAKVVGESSHGKDTVQTSYQFTYGGLVKVTTARWLTPEGNSVHQKGVEPDIVIQQPDFYKAMPIEENKTLALDMNDAGVKKVQVILTGLKYNPGRKDGYFSKETEKAVRLFQKDHKLKESGKVDTKTKEKLEQAIVKAIKDPKNDAQLRKAVDVLKKGI